MEQQSSGELRRLLQDPGVAGVVLLFSPQVLCSLAGMLGTESVVEAYGLLSSFFKVRMGCKAVIDTQVGLCVSLSEAGDEVMRRLGSMGEIGAEPPAWVPPAQTLPISATHHKRVDSGEHVVLNPSPFRPAPLPVLSSSCPGWVCYCEKNARECLPYLSTCRSPQQITGGLVKQLWHAWGGEKRGRVATVAIMPCYEKKLEASRKDFLWESVGADAQNQSWKEVDCVLVAAEVAELIAAEGGIQGLECESMHAGQLFSPPMAQVSGFLSSSINEQLMVGDEQPHTTCTDLWSRLESLLRGLGSTEGGLRLVTATTSHGDSDGYCTYAYRHVARVLNGTALDFSSPVPLHKGRNADFCEATLPVPLSSLEALKMGVGASGVSTFFGADPPTKNLTFAFAYGFRNIQGVVSRIKKRQAGTGGGRFVFVEVMACPKGCANGGGLLGAHGDTAANVATGASKTVPAPAYTQVSKLLHDTPATSFDPHAVKHSLLTLEPCLSGESEVQGFNHWLAHCHTQYHSLAEATSLVAVGNKW